MVLMWGYLEGVVIMIGCQRKRPRFTSRDGQFNHPPFPPQFTCWSDEGESQRLDNGLILSSRPKLLGGGGTVGLLLFATVLRA